MAGPQYRHELPRERRQREDDIIQQVPEKTANGNTMFNSHNDR